KDRLGALHVVVDGEVELTRIVVRETGLGLFQKPNCSIKQHQHELPRARGLRGYFLVGLKRAGSVTDHWTPPVLDSSARVMARRLAILLMASWGGYEVSSIRRRARSTTCGRTSGVLASERFKAADRSNAAP